MAEAAGRPIGFGPALLEQVRWFWQRMRVWIVIVAVLVSVAASWMIIALPDGEQQAAMMIVAVAFHPLLLLIALSWAFSAWRDDPPKDRQYFWLHPVGRTSHTAARSVAAGLWLLAVVAVIAAVIVVTVLITQGGDAEFGSARFWSYVVGGIALAYIVSSISPLLSNKPGVWLVVLIALIIITDAIATMREIEWLKRAVDVFNDGKYSLGTALSGPSVEAMRMTMGDTLAQATAGTPMAQIAEAAPGTALLIWLPIAVALYAAAALLSRPR